MGLLGIFTQAIRREVADAVRLGVVDGIKLAIGDAAPAPRGEADQAETELTLLLLPAPAEEKPAAKRKGGAA